MDGAHHAMTETLNEVSSLLDNALLAGSVSYLAVRSLVVKELQESVSLGLSHV